jgi:hypothetical protein
MADEIAQLAAKGNSARMALLSASVDIEMPDCREKRRHIRKMSWS